MGHFISIWFIKTRFRKGFFGKPRIVGVWNMSGTVITVSRRIRHNFAVLVGIYPVSYITEKKIKDFWEAWGVFLTLSRHHVNLDVGSCSQGCLYTHKLDLLERYFIPKGVYRQIKFTVESGQYTQYWYAQLNINIELGIPYGLRPRLSINELSDHTKSNALLTFVSDVHQPNRKSKRTKLIIGTKYSAFPILPLGLV